MERSAAGLADLGAFSSLGDPTRRRLYTLVVEAGRPVGRAEAASGAGIGRSLAAYHLDKLAEDGLLEVDYARPPGRAGPGAGRPAKLYRRAAREFVLCAPPRDYRLLAELLIRSAAGGERMAVKAALERAAAELGESLAAAGERLEQILRDHGYEPFLSEHGVLRLRNCPFDSVAGQCPAVVCDLNLALIRGILTGLGADPGRASLKPQRGNCCVAIRSYEDGKEVPVNPDFMSGTWLGHPPDPPLTMS